MTRLRKIMLEELERRNYSAGAPMTAPQTVIPNRSTSSLSRPPRTAESRDLGRGAKPPDPYYETKNSNEPECEQVLVIVILVLIASFVMVDVCTDLSADLACREQLCMDVPVYGIGGKRGDDCREIASRYVLCRGSYHSCCRYRACHSHLSPCVVRAGRSSRRTVPQIRTEEHHDTPSYVFFAEMDVSLRDIG